MKLKTGQIVHVRATVVEPEPDKNGDVRLTLQSGRVTMCNTPIHRDEIVHVEPEPLAVGDTARCRGVTVEIKAIDGDHAWCRTISPVADFILPHFTAPLADLERVP